MNEGYAPTNSIVTIIEPVFSSFYLNIVLLNKDEVVDKMVKEKVGSGPLGFGVGAKMASCLAKKAATDEKVTGQLGEKLLEMLPKQIADMGIDLKLTKRYLKGPLVVLKAEILETDPVKLISKAKGDTAGQHMKQLQEAVEFLELETAKKQMASSMMKQAREKLMEKLVETLPQKLSEAAGARVEINALSEADEAEWFFSFLE